MGTLNFNTKYVIYFSIAFLSYFLLQHGYVISFIFAILTYNVSSCLNALAKEEKVFRFSLSKILRIIGITFLLGIITIPLIYGILYLINYLSSDEVTKLIDIINTNLTSFNEQFSQFLLGYGIEQNFDNQFKDSLVSFFKANASSVSQISLNFSVQILKILIGIILGGILSFMSFDKIENYRPLSRDILIHTRRIREAFNKIFVAQFKISLIDAALTAIYLKVALPFFEIELPFAKMLILLTFIFGLLPVVGNLISNTLIVLVSLKSGIGVSAVSLGFLVVIHKLEYVLNAKIIGKEINSSIIELLFVMILFEGLFGIAGLILSTILYAYVKKELYLAGLIGKVSDVAINK